MRKPCSSASKVNHSLTKPPSGGIAASVSEATPSASRAQRQAAPEAAERVERALAGRLLDAVDADQRERLGEVVRADVQRRGEQSGGGERGCARPGPSSATPRPTSTIPACSTVE
jgi:hypothetical protein